METIDYYEDDELQEVVTKLTLAASPSKTEFSHNWAKTFTYYNPKSENFLHEASKLLTKFFKQS